MNGFKQSSYLIDSNIFLRFLIHDDKRMWQDCIDLFRIIEQGGINVYIPTIVAAEVQFVLLSFYGFDRRQIITAMKSITAVANLRLYDDMILPVAISLYEKKNVKFIDCCLAASMRVQTGEASIISYDHDFDKLGIKRVEPKQLLA